MKSNVLNILTLLLLFTACETKEEEFDLLGSVSIQLVHPSESAKNIDLSNIEITLSNAVDNTIKSAKTDANGIALFAQLPFATYNANATKKIEEFEITLTGVLNNIVVQDIGTTHQEITVNVVEKKSDLVIKEVFATHFDYFTNGYKDQFVEIFNNSSEVIYADGLYVGSSTPSFAKDVADKPLSEYVDIEKKLYCDWLVQLPGDGKSYPIAPSKSIIICLNAMNFEETNLDLTIADFEHYTVEWLEDQGRQAAIYMDFDNSEVKNTLPIFMCEGRQHLYLQSDRIGLFLFRDSSFDKDVREIVKYSYKGRKKEKTFLTVGTEKVIDAVEILGTSEQGRWKTLASFLDASFCYAKPDGQAYQSGISLVRKLDEKASNMLGRNILIDTNNSYNDFFASPTPQPKSYEQ